MRQPAHSHGFTLVELIMVIVLVGILATMTTDIITLPVKSYFDLERRTTLADTAELALRRMQRDIRHALPNSIRIKTAANSVALELLHTVDGGRYRHSTGAADIACTDSGDNILGLNSMDSCFDVIGVLSNFAAINTSADWLILSNTGAIGANAYSGNNRALLSAASTASKIYFVAKTFASPPLGMPPYRFFIVDTPITYRCDLNSETLVRYDGYSISAVQPDPPVGGSPALQANKVSACSFRYADGAATRSGLVTLEMILTDEAGESARLIHQVHVANAV